MKLLLFCDNNERRRCAGIDRLSVDSVHYGKHLQAYSNLAIEAGVIAVYPSLLLPTRLDPFFFCDFLSSHSCIDNVMGKKARST
jgi:hypothetical protein